MRLRIGTRGSELASARARWLATRLVEAHPSLEVEEVVLPRRTADTREHALGRALLAGEIDLTVQPCKGLTESQGLVIAAVPRRAAREDRLVCRDAATAERVTAQLEGVDEGPPLRIGTNSPRRAAQLLHWLGADAVPIRGSVSARIAAVQSTPGMPGEHEAPAPDLDAVMLSGAALDHLGLAPLHVVPLALEDFPTAPGQGALAVCARAGSEAAALAHVLDDDDVRRAVDAERTFLAALAHGPHTAVAAMAEPDGSIVRLHAQVFVDAETDPFDEVSYGTDAGLLGGTLARRAIEELGLTRDGAAEPGA